MYQRRSFVTTVLFLLMTGALCFVVAQPAWGSGGASAVPPRPMTSRFLGLQRVGATSSSRDVSALKAARRRRARY